MSAPTTDAISAYLAVLRGIGLNESEIRRLHDGSGSDPLDRILTDAIDATTNEQWHDQLIGTLCRSPQGLDLPRFYKSQAVADAIARMARAHGYEAAVEPKQGREFALELTDELTGETDHVMVGYPKTDLGADNLPALLAAIEQVRFADDGLTVALLSTSERWQAILVEQSALDGLTEQFGERIEPFEQPVLAEHSPVDFAIDPPVPGQAPKDSLEDPSQVDLQTWLEGATDESTEEVIEALEQSGTKRVVAENKSDDVLATMEESAEPPQHEPKVTETDPELTGTESVTQSTADDKVAPDDITLPEDSLQVDSESSETESEDSSPTSVHATGEVDVEAFSIEEDEDESSTDPAAPSGSEADLSSIGGGPKKTVSTDGIDEVFEKLEEQALEPDELARPVSRSETESPSLDSAFSDDEIDEEFGTLSGSGPKRSVSSTSADDILSAAEETDFDSYSDETSTDHVETDPDSLLDSTGEMRAEANTIDRTDASDPLEPDSETMDEFVDDGFVGESTSATASHFDEEDSPDDSLENIEGLADRVAERLSTPSSSKHSRDWTEATDGGPSGGSQAASVQDSTPPQTETHDRADIGTADDSTEEKGESSDEGLDQFRFPGRETDEENSESGSENGFAIPDDEFELETDEERIVDQSESEREE